MKALMLALSLVSLPAFADGLNSVNPQADLCFGNHNLEFCLGNRPSYPPPYHPGWGPAPRPVQCVAQNWRGYQFAGYGRWYQEAQNNALSNCYYSGSRNCRIVWCR